MSEQTDELADLLSAIGWRPVADAQHALLRNALPRLAAVLSPTKARDDGGSAFPRMPPQDTAAGVATGYPYPECGMSLRDYFAAKAMQADLANTTTAVDEHWRDGIAVDAYKMADAMLQARAQ